MADLNTELLWAAASDNVPACLELLGLGADIEAMNRYKDRPLHTAISNGSTSACLKLIERGANIHAANCFERTPLSLAAQFGCASICLALIDRGADIHAANQYDWRAQHWASVNGRTANCLALLERGGNPLAKNSDGHSALDLAIKGNHGECSNAIRSFIAAWSARAALQEISFHNAPKALSP